MRKLRLGLVSSLESRPLVWSFLKGQHGDVFAPSLHRPGQIGALLARQQLDVALLPAHELVRIDDLSILPDLCVAGRGSSIRIVLALRSPLAEVRSVSVPLDARWAVALMRVVLAERYGLHPEVVEENRPAGASFGPCDAVLSAGYGNLDEPSEADCFDLGAAWQDLSSLPFVAAVWAVRRGVQLPELPLYFKNALRYGLQSLDHLVREAAAELGLDAAAARRYLEEELRFVLGPEEEAGLVAFLHLARRHGLNSSQQPIPIWGDERTLG